MLRFFLILLLLLPCAAQAEWYSSSGRIPPGQLAPSSGAAAGAPEGDYRLGAGDKLRVTVYNEPDLSGEFEVDGSGRISLPLIGQVAANRKSVQELEAIVADRFRDGYLVNPQVSIEVMNFRHFYIMGEVKNPGSYPYVNALTVLNAVALAGGYTYRAKESDMTILRASPGGTTQEIDAEEGTRVLPEDTIKIRERLF